MAYVDLRPGQNSKENIDIYGNLGVLRGSLIFFEKN